jgi:hypothetical protein
MPLIELEPEDDVPLVPRLAPLEVLPLVVPLPLLVVPLDVPPLVVPLPDAAIALVRMYPPELALADPDVDPPVVPAVALALPLARSTHPVIVTRSLDDEERDVCDVPLVCPATATVQATAPQIPANTLFLIMLPPCWLFWSSFGALHAATSTPITARREALLARVKLAACAARPVHRASSGIVTLTRGGV